MGDQFGQVVLRGTAIAYWQKRAMILDGRQADLTFYGQGSEVIMAQLVKTEEARKIMELLGY